MTIKEISRKGRRDDEVIDKVYEKIIKMEEKTDLIQAQVNTILHDLRGNGSIGLIEQTKNNNKAIEKLTDFKYKLLDLIEQTKNNNKAIEKLKTFKYKLIGGAAALAALTSYIIFMLKQM